MTPDDLAPLVQRGLYVLLLAMAPLVLPALIVGLLVGMIQAATSINEATLAFVPKLVVTVLMLALFGGGVMGLLTDFTQEVFAYIPELAR